MIHSIPVEGAQDLTAELLAVAHGVASNIDAIAATLADPRISASAAERLRQAQTAFMQARGRLIVAADVFAARQ